MIIHFKMQSPTETYTYSATFKGRVDHYDDGYISDVDTSDLEWFVRQNNLDILDWEYEGYLPEYEGFERELYTLLDDVIEEEMVKGIKVKKVERNVDVLDDGPKYPLRHRFYKTLSRAQDYGSDEDEMAKASFTLVHLDNGYSVLIEDYEGEFSRAELLNKDLRYKGGDTDYGLSISYPKLKRMGKAKQAIAILPDLVENQRKSFSDD